MIKINSKQEKTLAVDLEIQNTAHRPDLRFVIETKSGVNLSIPALMEGTSAIVKIPVLEKLMPFIQERQLSAKLEAILEEQYFTVWKGDIEIETPISIAATKIEETESEPVKAAITAVSMKEVVEDTEEIIVENTKILKVKPLNDKKPNLSMKDKFRSKL